MKLVNAQLDMAVLKLIECFKSGGKLMVCGNGGSSSDSAHIVGELVKGFLKKRPLPPEWNALLGKNNLQMGLPALDLTAQGAVISERDSDGNVYLDYEMRLGGINKLPDEIILVPYRIENNMRVYFEDEAVKIPLNDTSK